VLVIPICTFSVRRSVSAFTGRRLRSGGVGCRLSTTAVALPGECLELRGRAGRRSDVAVDHPVRCVDGARHRRSVDCICCCC